MSEELLRNAEYTILPQLVYFPFGGTALIGINVCATGIATRKCAKIFLAAANKINGVSIAHFNSLPGLINCFPNNVKTIVVSELSIEENHDGAFTSNLKATLKGQP